MVHPIQVLRPGALPKHALAHRSHRLCCPTPSASFGCTMRRSQIAMEPAAPLNASLPAIAARPLVNTASADVRCRIPRDRRGQTEPDEALTRRAMAESDQRCGCEPCPLLLRWDLFAAKRRVERCLLCEAKDVSPRQQIEVVKTT